jgi:hypothetical protein
MACRKAGHRPGIIPTTKEIEMSEKYEVQTLIGNNWENVWQDGIEPETFDTPEEACAAIDEFFRDLGVAGMVGRYTRADYRVRRIGQ